MPPDAGEAGKGPTVSPRTKVHLLWFIAFPIGSAALVGILNSISPSLVALALLYPVLINAWTGSIRCPQCDRSIAWHRSSFLGRHLLMPSCSIGRYCVHCGYDLDQEEAEPDQR
jgi:hypothetical protein